MLDSDPPPVYAVPFNEEKMVQFAAMFLRLNRGMMNYLKLSKLLYMCERKSLINYGTSLFYGQLASMDHGPVIVEAVDRLTNKRQGCLWARHITVRPHYLATLLLDPGADLLSEEDVQMITALSQEFEHKDPWTVKAHTHKFPEWKNPHGGRIDIAYEEVLALSAETACDDWVSADF